MSQATELIARQMAAGSANARVWADILYNVKLYGAKGNGTTDDTASVQATIDAAIAAGGKAVFFPHGTYKVTTLTNLSSVVLFGDNASFVGISTTINQIGSPTSNLAINVKEYGAKGDGATDDSAAIQAAINACSTAGGGIVFFPPGTYLSGHITMLSNVQLVGSGRNISIIKMKNATNVDFIGPSTTTSSNYGFKDLSINGNNANNTNGSGLVIWGTDVKIINCEISNFPSYGMFAINGSRLVIEDCYIHHNKNVGVLIGGDGSTYSEVDISNCNITTNDSHGLLIGNGSTALATRVTIDSNIVTLNGANIAGGGGGGIWVTTGGSNVTISGNVVYSNNGDNIGIAGGLNVNITGNQSSNAAGVTIDQVNSGIAISAAAKNIVIDGNECFYNSAAGIMIRGDSGSLTVSNNICWNNSQYVNAGAGYPAGSFHGIQVDTISPDTKSGSFLTIIGNHCFDDQATKTQGYGLKLDANTNAVICNNNILSGNLIGQLLNNIVLTSPGSIAIIVDNIGYNPVGSVTAPTLASGAGIKNTFAFPIRVFIYGGTITSAFLGAAQIIGFTSGMVILEPGETMQINYSVAPNWTWVGM